MFRLRCLVPVSVVVLTLCTGLSSRLLYRICCRCDVRSGRLTLGLTRRTMLSVTDLTWDILSSLNLYLGGHYLADDGDLELPREGDDRIRSPSMKSIRAYFDNTLGIYTPAASIFPSVCILLETNIAYRYILHSQFSATPLHRLLGCVLIDYGGMNAR